MSAMQNLSFKGVEINGAELQKLLASCWTINDMVERFRVSGMTIHNWRNFRGLPAVVITGEVRPALRFIPSEVTAWAKTNNVKMYGARS
jgi:hypothetical protein